MNIDFSHILSLGYLFNLNPGPILPVFFKLLAPFFILQIIFGFISSRIAKFNKFPPIKLFFNKLYHFLLTMGLIGLALLLFRQQGIVFLAVPFLLLLWLMGFIVWFGFVLKYYFTDRPKKTKKIEREKENKKYLPH